LFSNRRVVSISDQHPPFATPARERSSLGFRLALLVAGTTLPLILFAAGVIYLNYIREREAAFDRVLETVRGMRLVLDSETRGITAALDVLASSNALRRDDFDAFRSNVRAFVQRYPDGSAISIATRDGTQIFNSRLPPGATLPHRTNVESIDFVFRNHTPAYSNLFIGSVSGRRLITVSVPVFRNGEVVYELGVNPPLETFQQIITAQRPSEDWTVSIFDRSGTNFARVPNPQETIGQKASPTLLPELLKQDEGQLTTYSLEGVELLTAFTRSPLSGWTVAAGIPTTTLTAPLWRALAMTLGIGAVMLAIGLAFAIRMATHIARSEMLLGLMVQEVNHRVKNTLATVQSISSQTFRQSTNPQEAVGKFNARLLALGRAHDVLSEQTWKSADLREIIEGVLEPFPARDGRVHLAGPDLRLSPRAAVMTAMVLHELATNAAKYGALSTPQGEIVISWDVRKDDEAGRMMTLTWREIGGPPPQTNPAKGFGSRLIERGFVAQLNGRASVTFSPSGLVCVLECPCQ
jgi:two-component sensor histidine kinase